MGLLAEIEAGLIAQLTPAFTNPGDARPWLKVESWPTRPEGYKLTGAGDVLVIYKGARYKPESTSSVFYLTQLEFEITIRSRTLRDNAGAYDLIETARRATCGKRLEASAGITLAVRDDFIDYGEGVFAYALVVQVPVVIVQDVDEPAGPWVDSSSGAGTPLSDINYVPA